MELAFAGTGNGYPEIYSPGRAVHEDRADRRAEKLGCAKGGVGVEKYFCAVAEDLSVLYNIFI